MKKLLLSFSGGETSAYMTQWCLNHLKDTFQMVVVFANTGEENEETLRFVKKCDDLLDFNTVWVEADVKHGERIGTKHTIVDYNSASRNGEPFEEVIKKYGIPNQAFPHCTRELKTAPILSYVKNELGWNNFHTAIGIRVDEFDRMDSNAEEKKYIYPLVDHIPMTKAEVNLYWKDMPFRLNLAGYQGNCKACWKKSMRKLYIIAKDNPDHFSNMMKWEERYKNHAPRNRSIKKAPFHFFRGNKSAKDILAEAQVLNVKAPVDDSKIYTYQQRLFDDYLDKPLGGCGDTCEPF